MVKSCSQGYFLSSFLILGIFVIFGHFYANEKFWDHFFGVFEFVFWHVVRNIKLCIEMTILTIIFTFNIKPWGWPYDLSSRRSVSKNFIWHFFVVNGKKYELSTGVVIFHKITILHFVKKNNLVINITKTQNKMITSSTILNLCFPSWFILHTTLRVAGTDPDTPWTSKKNSWWSGIIFVLPLGAAK